MSHITSVLTPPQGERPVRELGLSEQICVLQDRAWSFIQSGRLALAETSLGRAKERLTRLWNTQGSALSVGDLRQLLLQTLLVQVTTGWSAHVHEQLLTIEELLGTDNGGLDPEDPEVATFLALHRRCLGRSVYARKEEGVTFVEDIAP